MADPNSKSIDLAKDIMDDINDALLGMVAKAMTGNAPENDAINVIEESLVRKIAIKIEFGCFEVAKAVHEDRQKLLDDMS